MSQDFVSLSAFFSLRHSQLFQMRCSEQRSLVAPELLQATAPKPLPGETAPGGLRLRVPFVMGEGWGPPPGLLASPPKAAGVGPQPAGPAGVFFAHPPQHALALLVEPRRIDLE